MYVTLCLLNAHAPPFLMNSHKFPPPFSSICMSAPTLNFPFKNPRLILNRKSQRWSLHVSAPSPQDADLLNKAAFLSSQHWASSRTRVSERHRSFLALSYFLSHPHLLHNPAQFSFLPGTASCLSLQRADHSLTCGVTSVFKCLSVHFWCRAILDRILCLARLQ